MWYFLIYWCNNQLRRTPHKPNLFKVCHRSSYTPCFPSGRIYPISRRVYIYKWKSPRGICSGWKYWRLIWLFVEKGASHFPENIDEWSPDTQQGAKFRGVKLMWLHLCKPAMNLIQNDTLRMCGDIKDIQGLGTNALVNHKDPSIKKQNQTNIKGNKVTVYLPFS